MSRRFALAPPPGFGPRAAPPGVAAVSTVADTSAPTTASEAVSSPNSSTQVWVLGYQLVALLAGHRCHVERVDVGGLLAVLFLQLAAVDQLRVTDRGPEFA
jgi:hypothetical protein